MLVCRRKTGDMIRCSCSGRVRIIRVLSLCETQVTLGVSMALSAAQMRTCSDEDHAPLPMDLSAFPGFVTSKEIDETVHFLLEAHMISLKVLGIKGPYVNIGLSAPEKISLRRVDYEVSLDTAPPSPALLSESMEMRLTFTQSSLQPLPLTREVCWGICIRERDEIFR